MKRLKLLMEQNRKDEEVEDHIPESEDCPPMEEQPENNDLHMQLTTCPMDGKK